MIETIPSVVFEFAGLAGVAFYLGSYAALQLGLIRGSGYAYSALNLVAATGILVSLADNFNLWSAITQSFWILLSIYGLGRIYLLNSRLAFTAEEHELLARWFAQVSPYDARRFLRAGSFLQYQPDHQLAAEGEVIGALYFLIDGAADARSSGHYVGTVIAPGVVGELTCLTGDPAGATVITSAPTRVFRIDTEALRDLVHRNPDIKLNLFVSLGQDTQAKLAAANRRLSTG